ncbi:MAG: MlaD family protein [Phycisphaerales bacterium]|nr:MlaD family protein [Phycisphaerales bacterium]
MSGDTNAQSVGSASPPQPRIPTAVLRPRRRFSLVWLVPLAALIFTGWLTYKAWEERGTSIAVQLDNGHGLKAGDAVRYRGIAVGKVDSISILPDLQGVLVKARLTSQSEQLARNGSRFWVVRPQLRLTQIEGVDTLIGPRFLAVLPSPQTDRSRLRRQRTFVGLNEPPIVENYQPGDLEIILQATQRGSLHAGAPISFRQTRVGTILSVGLASDGGTVEARAHIQQPFVQLIRPQTKFWDVGGLQAKVGFSGVSIDIESAEALLVGGVALATPPPDKSGGEIVRTGHRFVLAPEPEDAWTSWQPMVAIGSSLLPPGTAAPTALRATLGWKQGRIGDWLKAERSRQGWVLQTSQGLLGPCDLLRPSEKADLESIVLEVAGVVIPLNPAPPVIWERNGLSLLQTNVSGVQWPASHLRPPKADQPEDCLAIGDAAAAPFPLAAARLASQEDGSVWAIDSAVSLDPSWHGACVVSRSDGRLIGMVLVDDNSAKVALLAAN